MPKGAHSDDERWDQVETYASADLFDWVSAVGHPSDDHDDPDDHEHTPAPPDSSAAAFDTDNPTLRRIGTDEPLFHGFVCAWDPSLAKGTVKALSGTYYEFSSADLANPDDAGALHLGLPTVFVPFLDKFVHTARQIQINWCKVLIKSHECSWYGPDIPVKTLSLLGSIMSWHKSARGVIQVGEINWKTSFEVANISVDPIDRLTICKMWPVYLDLVRDEGYLKGNHFTASGLRVAWKKVFEMYAEKLAVVGLHKKEWKSIIKNIKPTESTSDDSIERLSSNYRPLLAELVSLPFQSITSNEDGSPGTVHSHLGLMKPIDRSARPQESKVTFSIQNAWPKGIVLKRGQKVLYWTSSKTKLDPEDTDDHAVLIMARPGADGTWPSIIYSPPL